MCPPPPARPGSSIPSPKRPNPWVLRFPRTLTLHRLTSRPGSLSSLSGTPDGASELHTAESRDGAPVHATTISDQTTAPHVVGGGTADTQCRSSQFQCIVRTHTHASKHARTAASLLVPRSPPRCSHGAPHTCAPPPSLLSTWTCTPPSAPRSSPEAHPRPKRDRRSSDRCACAWAARRASPWPARAAAAPSCRRSTP